MEKWAIYKRIDIAQNLAAMDWQFCCLVISLMLRIFSRIKRCFASSFTHRTAQENIRVCCLTKCGPIALIKKMHNLFVYACILFKLNTLWLLFISAAIGFFVCLNSLRRSMRLAYVSKLPSPECSTVYFLFT